MDKSHNRKNKSSAKASQRQGARNAHVEHFPDVGLEDPAAEEDGLELDIYAERNQMSVEDVWQLLRDGKILGRLVRGKLLVFEHETSLALIADATPFDFKDLPPLPGREPSVRAQSLLHNDVQVLSHSQEVALLIDHLSIAKEENREILKLTQDALSRISELNQQVVALKDTLIETKDQKIKEMADDLDRHASDLRKVLRDKEDLETLVKTLSSNL